MTKAKLKLGVLISGGGTNLQALIDACAAADFPAEIALVLSNVSDAYGLERAKKANIQTSVINHKDFDDRDSFEVAMTDELKATGVELVCLAGFMRILNNGFVNSWRDRMINMHPSILPAFKGLHTHDRVVAEGVKFSGCTVHFVVPDLDSGPIIIQAVVPVNADDTGDTLGARVLEMEHKIYPEAVRLIATKAIRVSNNCVQIKDGAYAAEGVINPSLAK
jgi:phosphoribosylglycinamide formyltransferase-1